jgi:hypothetical protein
MQTRVAQELRREERIVAHLTVAVVVVVVVELRITALQVVEQMNRRSMLEGRVQIQAVPPLAQLAVRYSTFPTHGIHYLFDDFHYFSYGYYYRSDGYYYYYYYYHHISLL